MNDNKFVLGVATIIIGVGLTTLMIFGLAKLGGKLFDMSPARKTDAQHCWEAGGVPIYDNTGVNQDFKGCNKGGNNAQVDKK